MTVALPARLRTQAYGLEQYTQVKTIWLTIR
jgi:hypothetical protein